MSLHVFVGPSKTGKTFFMREFLLPALLTVPDQVTGVKPSSGFKAVLIDDPPTSEFPDGQFHPGPWYEDVAEWRRAEARSKVARFRSATPRALFAAALELGGLVLCLDDMEAALGNVNAGGVAKPSDEGVELLTRGRLHGCLVIGAVRRWGALHALARSNVERAYFGHLSDEGDRKAAAGVAGVDASLLAGYQAPGVFLEWDQKGGTSTLVRIENRRKMVLRRL